MAGISSQSSSAVLGNARARLLRTLCRKSTGDAFQIGITPRRKGRSLCHQYTFRNALAAMPLLGKFFGSYIRNEVIEGFFNNVLFESSDYENKGESGF
jgi:hypothetical protein